MIPIVVAILGIISVAIPTLARWLEKKTGGYSVWKSEIAYWLTPPPSIGDEFFGRAAELEAVAKAFKRGHHVALSGMPGVGKSQLAAEFVKKSKRKGFWTSGGDTPDQTMIALARHLGIVQEEQTDDEVLFQTRQRLQALPGKILWVVDHLTDLDQLNGLLAQTGNVSLLITSQDGRESVVPQSVEFLPIGVLDPDPAVRLLCRNPRHDRYQPVFLELVEEVGRLPQAVEALAVQLDSPTESPERLLDELRTAPNPLELDRFKSQTGGLHIQKTESLFNALRGPIDALPGNIREALGPLGYTADLPISMPLAEALTGLSNGDLVNFFEECHGKSALFADCNQVTLHSLTAAAIAATNPDVSLQTALQRFNSRLFAILNTRQLVPTEELVHHEQMLSWASTLLNREDPAFGTFSANVASAFLRSGRFKEAVIIYQEDLEILQRVLGSDHPKTLLCSNNLASAYGESGDFDKAASILKETLGTMDRVLGQEHPDTLLSRNNLASAYNRIGRSEEAAALHEENLSVMERVLGPEHLLTLTSRDNLASAYHRAGFYDLAATIYQENLKVMERVNGPEHPDTLICRNNLASAIGGGGHPDEAAKLHQENLEVMERVLGPEHPETLVCRDNLASAYNDAGRSEEAAKIQQENLALMVLVLRAEHPETLISRDNLATTYRALGKISDADALFEKN